MDWLNMIRNSPITKIILMILTVLLGGAGVVDTVAAYQNAPEGAMLATEDTKPVLAWWISTIIAAVGAFISGPTGQAFFQKINAKWRQTVDRSNDPNVKWAAQFQAWDYLAGERKDDAEYQIAVTALGNILIARRSQPLVTGGK